MSDEPKSPAELKEIRLNRKRTQDAEGIKAMADIAAADVAIRKRTMDLRAMRLAKEAAEPPRPAAIKKGRGKPAKKSEMKTPALSDWLAGQQNGGRRT